MLIGRRAVALSVVLAAGSALSCRPELVVRLSTRAYDDGSMDRTVEVLGRRSDGRRPTDDDWLAERVGVRLAEPEAWSSVETSPGRLKAEGFFRSGEELPPILSFQTVVAARQGRTRTMLEVDDRVLLRRWSYIERHGDPFDHADSAAALDALAGLVVEALRQEVHAHFGSAVDTSAAERFVREEARALTAALLAVHRSASGWERAGERAERWSSVLSQHGVPVGPADADDYWETQLPAILEWSRDRVAASLSTSDAPIRADELTFWPLGDDLEERATGIIGRVWGSEKEFYERIEPHLGALAGYYGGDDVPWFRFEARVQLPGTLLRTNGTPDGESIVWFFRERDLTFGEVSLRAESVELQTEPLVSLGARREFDRIQLVRLADLLFKRDPHGTLTAILEECVLEGSLDPLEDEDSLPDELILVASELATLLDPDTPLD